MAFLLMALAQGSRVVPPKNRYKVCDEVQLGRHAGAQVERQLPPLPENSEIDAYVERMGRRLVEAVPTSFSIRGPLTSSTWSMRARSTLSRCRAVRCTSIAV